jgi:hypothetical protein
MKTFNDFLNENKSIHYFDVDDTLMKTSNANTKIHVNDESGKRVHTLNSGEYNSHKLHPGHSYDYSEFKSSDNFTKNAKPIVGTYLQYAFGTALIYDYLSKDKLNFEKIEIYKPGQGIDYWKNTSMKLLQPGDIVDTITVATRNGHIGVVSDTQNNRPGTWDIISNSSSGYNPLLGVKIGTIKSNYNTYSWGSGVATRSGVGPTYIFRFKCGRGATWGKTLGIPQT